MPCITHIFERDIHTQIRFDGVGIVICGVALATLRVNALSNRKYLHACLKEGCLPFAKSGSTVNYNNYCDELNQSRCNHAYMKRITCTIGSSIYKNLKLRKKRRRKGSQQPAGGLI